MEEAELNSTTSGYFASANDVILSLTGLFAVLLDVILIFIILHFRRLDKTVYLFLVHRSFAELIRLVINPVTFSLIDHYMHIDLFNLLTQLSSLARTGVAFFEIFMVFDWMMENFFPNKLKPWRNKFNIVVTVVWTPVLFGFLWAFGHYKYISLVHLFKRFAGSTSLLCICLTILLQIIKCFMVYVKKKTFSDNPGLILVTFSVTMRVVALLLMYIVDRPAIFLYLEHLLMIVFIFYLSIFNEDFTICFKKFCVCNLKDDSADDSKIYLCQGCGAFVGFDELSSETIQENLPSTNNV